MYPFMNPQFPIPQYPANSFPQQNTSPRLVIKQVGSIDEAKGAIIDPFSLFVFVDFSCGKIYVKKMGESGQSEFYIYNQEQAQKQVDPMTEIRQRLANLEALLGGGNGKSVPDIPGNEKSGAGNNQPAGGENAPGQPGTV